MKLAKSLVLSCCLTGIASGGEPALVPSLEHLPTLRDFEMRRMTSADPSGGNRDWRPLEPGGTLVLADVEGPGCIVHFRDNVTSREPHHLQKHVLRMYWDGEPSPSVEVPFGDFFAVGFGLTEKYSSALMNIDARRGQGVTDPVPFRESIRFLIEHGRGNPPFQSGNDYYSAAYWYQTEPYAPPPRLPGVAERISWTGKEDLTRR